MKYLPITTFVGMIIVAIGCVYVLYYFILALAFGIPYMIGVAKLKLSCMTTKRKENHGQKEKQ